MVGKSHKLVAILLLLLVPLTCFAAKKKKAKPVAKPKPAPTSPLTVLTPEAEIQKIAEASGFSQLKNVQAIHFTYDARVNVVTVKRSWIWEPQTDRVTCTWHSLGIIPRHRTYSRDAMRPKDKKIDQWFIHDRFCLMLPFQLVWNKEAKITLQGVAPLPMPPGTARHLTMAYPHGGGDTPGDTYDIYYGEDYLIQQWSYTKSGSEEPTATHTWEGYVRAGPLIFSTERKDDMQTFHLTFENLGVKMPGDKTWRSPGPLK